MSNAVPSRWRIETIDAIARTSAGGTPSTQKPEYWDNGNIPWMSSGEVHKKRVHKVEQYITELGYENSSAKLFPKKTLLIALAGQGKTRGTAAISEIELTTNQSIAGIIVNDDTVSPDFLFHNLDSRYEELRAASGGAGRAGLNLTIIGEQNVLLPPLPEQQKIAAILSSVDDVIEKTQAQIGKLKDLKTGMMQELLTKGIGHTEFKDSPVGRIPVGWKVVEFGEHLDVRSGKGFSMSEYSKEGYRLLRIDNVSWGKITWDSIAYLPFSYRENYEPLVLGDGDILLALNRPITQGKLKLARVAKSDLPAMLYQRVGKILFKDNNVVTEFAYYWLAYWLFDFLNRNVVGSDQPFINISELRKVQMTLPPIGEQNKIFDALNSIDIRLSSVKSKLHSHKNIKKALMQDLLTGKVRVAVPSHLCDHGISASMHVEV